MKGFVKMDEKKILSLKEDILGEIHRFNLLINILDYRNLRLSIGEILRVTDKIIDICKEYLELKDDSFMKILTGHLKSIMRSRSGNIFGTMCYDNFYDSNKLLIDTKVISVLFNMTSFLDIMMLHLCKKNAMVTVLSSVQVYDMSPDGNVLYNRDDEIGDFLLNASYFRSMETFVKEMRNILICRAVQSFNDIDEKIFDKKITAIGNCNIEGGLYYITFNVGDYGFSLTGRYSLSPLELVSVSDNREKRTLN